VNVNRFNTQDEQILILKAVIEKKPVYYTKFIDGKQKQFPFVGTMPNFNMYRYDCDQTFVRGRVEFKESANFPGVADARGLSAEYARNLPPVPGTDTLEAWYEGGALHLRPLTSRKIVIFGGIGESTTLDLPKVPDPIPKRIAYAHPTDPTVPSVSQTLANGLRGTLRGKNRKFRTAQLCQTTKKYWRVADSQLHDHHKYTLLLVFKECVLESTNFNMSRKELTRFTCPRDTKIVGELTEINGVQFRVHWT
jgi:hypothetical protein